MSLSYPQETFNHTRFTPSSFLARRRLTVRKNTLLTQLSILKSTGRYDAFRLKWHPAYNPGYKALFWDSDIAKWLEGACYFLAEKGHDDEEDKVIDDAVEELTDMIASAQWKDGYLNINFTVVKPGLRFTNIRDLHELLVLTLYLNLDQVVKNGILGIMPAISSKQHLSITSSMATPSS